ncbi:MAG: radical SAM/SPASM domain-containing protein [Thermodesulfovibrionales bacterium]
MEYIQFFLNFRCNQVCNFCFNSKIEDRPEITLYDFQHIASILKSQGINEIDILGGEPFLHKDILQILEIATKSFDSIYISTNGTLIDILKDVERLFPKVKIGISLNSKPGKGLREYIVQHRPVLKSIVDRRNFVPMWALEFIKSGIIYYLIFRDALSEDELKEVIPFYEFIKEVEIINSIYSNIKPVYCSGFVPENGSEWRCPAGSTKLSIMPDGSVFPCYLFFGYSEFRLGNVLHNEFKEIIRNPILDFFKKTFDNQCEVNNCHIRSECHGGCPAVSWAIYRDLNMPDPRCNAIR